MIIHDVVLILLVKRSTYVRENIIQSNKRGIRLFSSGIILQTVSSSFLSSKDNGDAVIFVIIISPVNSAMTVQRHDSVIVVSEPVER